MGKLAQRLAIILLLLLATAMAIEPAGVSGYSAWVGVTNATFADSPSGPAGSTGSFIKIRAYYITDTIISSGRSGGSGDMGSGDIRTQQTAPLANATWQIFFDGKPLLNKSGTVICDAINTTDVGKLSGGQWLEPGEAICAQAGPFYAADPDPAKNGAPKALTNWTGCGMLQVRLVSAPDMSKVRNLNSPAMLYCPTHPQSLGLYNILGLGNLSPAFIATCLPIFIVLGLLIASMYQRGKDPLSLFDITTPRLPFASPV